MLCGLVIAGRFLLAIATSMCSLLFFSTLSWFWRSTVSNGVCGFANILLHASNNTRPLRRTNITGQEGVVLTRSCERSVGSLLSHGKRLQVER